MYTSETTETILANPDTFAICLKWCIDVLYSAPVLPIPNGPASASPARQLRKESRRKVEQARAKQQQTDSDSDLDGMVEHNRHQPPLPPVPPPVKMADNVDGEQHKKSDSDNDEQCKMSLAEKMAFFNRQRSDTTRPNRFHDRRRRFERAKTQPITEDDVAQASEQARIARSRSEGPLTEANLKREQNRAKSMDKETGEKSTSSEEDQLSKYVKI